MEIKFQQLSITLLPSGALYIHEADTLVLADLHLGKGVLLQDSGVPLIHQVDEETVAKLESDLRLYSPAQCVICGDLVHAKSRHMANQLQWFSDRMLFNVVHLTLENHDVKSYAPYLPHLIFWNRLINGIHCVHEPLTHGSFIAGHVHRCQN